MSSLQISPPEQTFNIDVTSQTTQSDSQQISSDDSGDAFPNSSSQPLSEELPTSPELPKHQPRKVIVYSRRHILNLSHSPLVQRPEGMPSLKDWFGEYSEQHPNNQTKKDASDTANTSGNRRFPRREQDEGGDTVLPPTTLFFSPVVENTRSTFRSTLSQPSQMGNFRHQSIRSDLTRNGDRDRDRDTDRDKEGHERLRSLSDMYDRERFGLPSTIPPLIRSQPRDSSGHHPSSSISGSGTSARITGRERIDRDRDKDTTRRSENRESTRRKGGESVDWRRGTDASRYGKDEPRGEGERERSTSRERWSERRGRDSDDKDKESDKVRSREEDRNLKTKDTEFHTMSGTSTRWSERPTDEKRKSKDGDDKDTKEERKDRDINKRDKTKEHPDTKRDRELREGWTIGEERIPSLRRTPGRGGERRTSGADEDREVRKERDREKDKEPAWMDDYVPEAGAPKTGIFGGKMEGMEDEIQAWKKRQALAKQQTMPASIPTYTVPPVINGSTPSSASSESFPHDGTVVTTDSIFPNPPPSTDEQAKASDAFFFGLMKGDGKAKSHNTTPAKSPEPEVSSANRSPAPMVPLSILSSPSSVDPAKVDPAVISAAPQGLLQTNNSSAIVPPLSSLSQSHDTLQTVHGSSPGSSLPSSTPGPIGSSALSNNDSSFKILPTTTPPASVSFNPPAQSRVLAFTQQQRANNSVVINSSEQLPIPPIGLLRSQPSPKSFPSSRGQPSPLVLDSIARISDSATQRPQFENPGTRSSFSPFDNNAFNATDATVSGGFIPSRQSSVDLRSGFHPLDALLPDRNPRASPQALLSASSLGQTGTHDSTPSPSSMYPTGRGSRFAKFWDKNKEAGTGTGPNTVGGFPPSAGGGILSPQGIPAVPQSASPSVTQQGRQHDVPSSLNGFSNSVDNNNIQDMLAMLQTAQGSRVNPPGLSHRPSIPSHMHVLHDQQQISHHQPQPQHHFTNTNSLLDHQYDSRSSFAPDGLVPGLRPSRNREGSLYTSDNIDDTALNSPFSVSVPPRQGQQSQQQQQHHQFERQTSGAGALSHLYNSQNMGSNPVGGMGVGGGRMFQPPFRAEPSPLNSSGPNALHRLPPGLANLGGRPPHDPNAYLSGNMVGGIGLGVGLGGMPGNAVSGAGVLQHQHQSFNGFGGGSNNPSANFGIGGMGVGGIGGLGGLGGPHGGQRANGGPGQLPMQSLLNPGGGSGMLAASGHHSEFNVQQPHHHHGLGVAVRGGPQGLQGQQHQQSSHGHLSLGGPPTSGLPGGGVRSAFVQPGISGPGGPGLGLSPLQAQLGIRQQQHQQQQHMLSGIPPQMPHLGSQQQPVGGGGGIHGLHPAHGHGGHGQTQNEHLLSMLMGGLVPRE